MDRSGAIAIVHCEAYEAAWLNSTAANGEARVRLGVRVIRAAVGDAGSGGGAHALSAQLAEHVTLESAQRAPGGEIDQEQLASICAHQQKPRQRRQRCKREHGVAPDHEAGGGAGHLAHRQPTVVNAPRGGANGDSPAWQHAAA